VQVTIVVIEPFLCLKTSSWNGYKLTSLHRGRSVIDYLLVIRTPSRITRVTPDVAIIIMKNISNFDLS
jgi:hypothetical protein